MKITVINRQQDDFEFRQSLEIIVDGEDLALDFTDGEPEDNNLSRDFNDVFRIIELVKLAYDAGIRDEELQINEINKEWW